MSQATHDHSTSRRSFFKIATAPFAAYATHATLLAVGADHALLAMEPAINALAERLTAAYRAHGEAETAALARQTPSPSLPRWSADEDFKRLVTDQGAARKAWLADTARIHQEAGLIEAEAQVSDHEAELLRLTAIGAPPSRDRSANRTWRSRCKRSGRL